MHRNRNAISYLSFLSFKVVTIGTIALFFTSCVFHDVYPSTWAKPIPVEINMDISGAYMASGEWTGGNYPKSLPGLLFPNQPIYGTHVQIAQSNDTLEISVWNAEKLVHIKLYSKENKEFDCTPKGIEIPYKAGIGGQGFELGVDWGTLYLTTSTDGALIVNKRTTATGVVLVIPVVGSSSTWYRFKQR